MYPSGSWAGFWEQTGWGRQRMSAFELHFRDDQITGGGTDVIGPFRISGLYESRSGRVRWFKQYLGKHRVFYEGSPDGEGNIGGTWVIELDGRTNTGTFMLKPELPRPTGDEPIVEIPVQPKG
jgi:hypothetical protein